MRTKKQRRKASMLAIGVMLVGLWLYSLNVNEALAVEWPKNVMQETETETEKKVEEQSSDDFQNPVALYVEYKTTQATEIVNAVVDTEKKMEEAQKELEARRKRAAAKKRYYTTTYVELKSSSSSSAQRVELLQPVTKVKVVEKKDGWAKVKVKADGSVGYVKLQSLTHKKEDAEYIFQTKKTTYRCTGYCSCRICSEGWGTQTASGKPCRANHTIAADLRKLPLGTKVYIEGLGEYVVEDVGGGVKGYHVDVYCNTHNECYGVTRNANLIVIE